MARMGLRAPVNVTWEITLKCNLHCAHCLSDAGAALERELTTRECRQLVDQLTDLKVFQVNIGGGEPFMMDAAYAMSKATSFECLFSYVQEIRTYCSTI